MRNWSDAQEFCQLRDMQSAIILNAQTSNLLKSNSMDNAWLAGRSQLLDSWTFVDGEDASHFVGGESDFIKISHTWQ